MNKITKWLFLAVILGQSLVYAGPLHDAVKDHDWAEVNRLLSSGTNIDDRNENGFTALMLAVGSGDEEAVKRCLILGANTEAKFGPVETALTLAAKSLNMPKIVKIIEDLLNHGAQNHTGDPEGIFTSALMRAFNFKEDSYKSNKNRNSEATQSKINEVMEIIKQWSIHKGISLYDVEINMLAQNGLGTAEEYNRDFAAWGTKEERKGAVERSTGIPGGNTGPASIIQGYLGE